MNAGKLLLLGEGEGRNAVYAAKKGWIVDAVDFSFQAKLKAEKLAAQHSAKINYFVNNLSDYIPAAEYYDTIGLIFLHLAPELRKKVHQKVIKSLKPGGKIIIEAFSKDQLGKKSGGPQNIQQLYSPDELKNDFEETKIIMLEEENENLSEGDYHFGEASIIKFIATK